MELAGSGSSSRGVWIFQAVVCGKDGPASSERKWLLRCLGNRIDLSAVRDRRAMLSRRSPVTRSNRGSVHRVAHTSREPVRKEAPSGHLDPVRGSDPYALKKARDSGAKASRADGNEMRKRTHEEGRKGTEGGEPRPPKKNHVEDPRSSSKPLQTKHIFVEGVNHKEKADSFWDLEDPEIGWKKGRSIVGDFDMLHLLSLPTDSFAHALLWNSCQGLSLASAVRVREEKLRDEQDKLREEVRRLKDENRRLIEDKNKGEAERLQTQRDLAGKVQEFAVLEEKYVLEMKTGGCFLNSETGKAFLKNVEEKSVCTFKASSTFHEEVLDRAVTFHDELVLACRNELRKNKVSEDIVMLIEPTVEEPKTVATNDAPLGDEEMIDALKSRLMDEGA